MYDSIFRMTKVSVLMDDKLRTAVKVAAAQERVSMTKWVENLIRKQLGFGKRKAA